MQNSQLRRLLKETYPNSTWARKVDRMSDQQVYSIVKRLENENERDKVEREEIFVQGTLF